jgi:hypothetical protein
MANKIQAMKGISVSMAHINVTGAIVYVSHGHMNVGTSTR